MDENPPDPIHDAQPGNAMGDGRPLVASATPVNSSWLWLGSALLVGALVFAGLTAQRLKDVGADGSATLLVAAAPDAFISVPPPPAELIAAESQGRGPVFASAPPAQLFADATFTALPVSTPPQVGARDPVAEEQRRKAPALIVDLAAPAQPLSGARPAATDASGRPGPSSLNGDEQFAERVGDASTDTSRATAMHKPQTMVTQGTMIPGVLETAMNSDLPGFVRAVVSRDVRGFDGSTVLIPRGSRLIGQYRSGVALGQSRAFVIWSRILRPDGASIQISSSGTDPLGRAGLQGDVNRHFFERFSGAILLSVLNAAVASVGDQPSTQIVIGSTNDAATLASGAIAPTNISPTIRVPQGSPIRIFVARDLDFSTVRNDAR